MQLNIVVLICQSFRLLYYTLNRGKNESCQNGLFNLIYFVNVLAILSQNFSLYFSYIKPSFYSTEQNTGSINFIFSLDFFDHLIFTFISYFLVTFIVVFFLLFFLLIYFALNFRFTFLLEVLFNKLTAFFLKQYSPSHD